MKKIALLMSVLMVLVLIMGCAQPGQQKPADGNQVNNQADDPSKTFEAFIKAIKDKDLQAAWDLMSEESKSAFKENGQPSFEKFKQEIGKELDNPEKMEEITSAVPISVKTVAEVKIKSKRGNEEREDSVKMIKEDGKWKVDLR